MQLILGLFMPGPRTNLADYVYGAHFFSSLQENYHISQSIMYYGGIEITYGYLVILIFSGEAS